MNSNKQGELLAWGQSHPGQPITRSSIVFRKRQILASCQVFFFQTDSVLEIEASWIESLVGANNRAFTRIKTLGLDQGINRFKIASGSWPQQFLRFKETTGEPSVTTTVWVGQPMTAGLDESSSGNLLWLCEQMILANNHTSVVQGFADKKLKEMRADVEAAHRQLWGMPKKRSKK